MKRLPAAFLTPYSEFENNWETALNAAPNDWAVVEARLKEVDIAPGCLQSEIMPAILRN